MTILALSDLLRSKSLLIFDLDGTLADTSPRHSLAFDKALARWGVSVNYGAIAGLTTESAVTWILRSNNIRVDERDFKRIVELKRETARRLIAEELKFLAYADDFLMLAQPLFKLALYSSGSRDTVQLSLRRLALTDVFSVVVTGQDIRRPKPHPDGFQLVLDLTGLPATEAVILEDSASGVEAGVRAGVDVIHIKSPSNEADCGGGAVISTEWSSLLAAVQRLPQ